MEKNVDAKGRLRKVIIGFRMSEVESENLKTKVKLSGLTKQDYIIKRLLEKEIVVIGNPRVYKALRDEIKNMLEELEKINKDNPIEDEMLEKIYLIVKTMEGMNK